MLAPTQQPLINGSFTQKSFPFPYAILTDLGTSNQFVLIVAERIEAIMSTPLQGLKLFPIRFEIVLPFAGGLGVRVQMDGKLRKCAITIVIC